LCELLGDVPNDPRGELRWCLSKLRTVLDEPGRNRLSARNEAISLDLGDCTVDAQQVEAAMGNGVTQLERAEVDRLCALMIGDFLEGLDLHRSPQLDRWIPMQRRRYRTFHAGLLERMAELLADDPHD